jgi:DNA-binding CsgD family transcriptional regulator
MSAIETPSSAQPPRARENECEVLYGREVELAMIHALLDHARASRGAVVVVRGEAGIGKSALLRDAAEHAGGMQILHAAGVESESELAFAGLHQLVRPLLGSLDEIPEHQRSALRAALGLDPSACSDRFLVSAAVLNLLAAAAEEDRPLLCIVDDAHWFDGASADALAFAARRIEAEPIVFLFSARVGDVRTFAPGLPELWLSGLDREAATRWLVGRWGDEISALVREQLLDVARGNPLALAELPKALSVDQRVGREPLGDPLPVTATVESGFLKRVSRLRPGARTLLLVAAADDTADTAIVRRAAESLGAGAADFDEAETAGLLHVGEAVVEFCHPLVRSAVYHAASFGKRQAAHRALVDVLADDHYSDRRAWHRAAATLGPDSDLADELERTADRARSRSGYGAAAAALERSAMHTPDESARGRRFAAAGQAAWLAGRPGRAATLAEEARRLASEPALRADIDNLRGMIELQEGVPADAHAILLEAAEVIAPVDARRAAALLLAAGEAAAFAGDAEGEMEAGRRANAMRAHLGEDRFELTMLAGISDLLSGNVAGGALLLRDAISSAELSSNPRRLSWAGTAALYTGDFPTARKFFSESVAEARTQGAIGLLALALQMLGLAELAEGRFASAAAGASEGLRLARETGQTNCTAHHLAVLAWVAALRGREEECRARASSASRIATDHGLGIQAGIVTAALGELELGLGHAHEALVHFGALWSSGPGSSHHVVRLLAVPSLIESAVRVEHLDPARIACRWFEDWVTSTSSDLQLPLLERCRALLSSGIEVTEHYERALRLHAQLGRPFDRARTELLYGEALRRARRRSDAREHLHIALDLFEKFGADSWVDRARSELRGSGMTARRRDPSTLDQLTPQELQVARFVADGATNKEVAAQLFLSPRTIDFHLRNIFAKLGITSRTQLSWFQLAEETHTDQAPIDLAGQADVRTTGFAGAFLALCPWDVVETTGGFAGAILALSS